MEQQIAQKYLDSLPFDIDNIPNWIIEKAAGKYAGMCIVCIRDGHIGIEHETEKAYLLSVTNDFSTPKCSEWRFWVAKSLLK